jgi:hypothetical protein
MFGSFCPGGMAVMGLKHPARKTARIPDERKSFAVFIRTSLNVRFRDAGIWGIEKRTGTGERKGEAKGLGKGVRAAGGR